MCVRWNSQHGGTAAEMLELSRKCELPLIADESLLTDEDAGTLLVEPSRVWWNVRLSKNGGPSRAITLMRRAAQAGVTVVLGCMVGESSLLSAAQRLVLAWSPQPRFVEGNYGGLLLEGDLTWPRHQFGFGGRLKLPGDLALGVKVWPSRLGKYGTRVCRLEA